MNYNPMIETYNDEPSQEAKKAAVMVSRFMFWMTNQSCKQWFLNAFGKQDGEHLWNKVTAARERYNDLAGDMDIWFQLSVGNRIKLMYYILKTGYQN